ncbi:MAG: hypothetical protein QXD77_00035 [Candidatus Aenigmatarchaeota archaeon]
MTMKGMRLKGSERTIMTVFWILFALGAAAVFFLMAIFIYTRLAGVKVV